MFTTALMVGIALVIYLVFYFTHGKYLEKKVARASPDRRTPAWLYEHLNPIDYKPTHKFVLYGHHFASIAGAGPIVGPALALAWGWLPALLWIWLGNVLIGVVHDYLALMASVRYDARSIAWIAGKLMHERAHKIFNTYIWFALVLVIAAFDYLIAALFSKVPCAGLAALLLILFAPLVGYVMYRTSAGLAGGLALAIVAIVVSCVIGYIYGDVLGAAIDSAAKALGVTSVQLWILILTLYAIAASALPVWILLQPRDFINAFILWFALGSGGLAAILVNKVPEIPAVTGFTAKLIAGLDTPLWPCIPLIVACGALSGFHSIVASGTTSKQLASELDALLVGYGGMLSEGFLATMIVATMSGFAVTSMPIAVAKAKPELIEAAMSLVQHASDPAYWGEHYAAIASALKWVIIPIAYAVAVHEALGLDVKLFTIIGTLWITCFALTSLDTGLRLGRLAWTELLESVNSRLGRVLTNRWIASAILAVLGAALAWNGSFLILWPSFAGVNQLLASLALMTIALWVIKVQRAPLLGKVLTVGPALFLWVTVTAALIWYLLFAVPHIVLVKGKLVTGVAVAIILGISLSLNFMLAALFARSLAGARHEAE